ncbi:hypothetical protein AU252_01040 [Pseudarthrobacter sulfonivorans]|uniref:HpcH/HpaI aldolase/citrate lyase domain-containing protein n=2 Tax=Pseudarthrobacter sulfonivorans TaxID=121292 RepID=A0A0U3FXE2_9MICC|nr:hypothetical protein AU252_01040 [Pseudarthrobacter sulfonivorans]
MDAFHSSVASARTFLFVPGNRPERFPKAAASAADLVVIDLEDAVPDDEKEAARVAASTWLAAGMSAAVRINGIGTEHCSNDIAAMSGLNGLSAVVIPMAADSRTIAGVYQMLGENVEIVALIETAAGVLNAREIAAAPGVARLAFGHLDFAADIQSSVESDAMLYARSTLVMASRAAGLPGPVDGVTTQLDDYLVAANDATRSRKLGFTGKLCIHPGQAEGVNAAFMPTDDERTWALRVLSASASGGAVRVGGEMVDAPIVLRAQDILRKSQAGESR